ncbi:MAG: hypothetical protein DHS20C21_13410 [Gemmatimonadota bacterium]|nr:MAG: hypothetical protein DHS20C21_13410 [Gemmatimonadota bacterium]
MPTPPVQRTFLAGLVTLMLAAPGAARDFRSYTPSSLLAPGEWEIQTFHNVYTQTAFFDDNGKRTDSGARATYYTGLLAVTMGRSGWNPGVDLVLRSVDDGAFAGGNASRTALSAVEPRVELTPFRRYPRLSVETGVRIPLGSDLEGDASRPFLDWDDPIWNTHIFFDQELGEQLFAYFEGGTQLRWDRGASDVQLTTPLKAILNLIPTERWTLYLPLEVAPDWIGDPRGNYYSQVGLGAKYRPVPAVELETLGTVFPFGRNAGAGATLNLGIRIIP